MYMLLTSKGYCHEVLNKLLEWLLKILGVTLLDSVTDLLPVYEG